MAILRTHTKLPSQNIARLCICSSQRPYLHCPVEPLPQPHPSVPGKMPDRSAWATQESKWLVTLVKLLHCRRCEDQGMAILTMKNGPSPFLTFGHKHQKYKRSRSQDQDDAPKSFGRMVRRCVGPCRGSESETRIVRELQWQLIALPCTRLLDDMSKTLSGPGIRGAVDFMAVREVQLINWAFAGPVQCRKPACTCRVCIFSDLGRARMLESS